MALLANVYRDEEKRPEPWHPADIFPELEPFRKEDDEEADVEALVGAFRTMTRAMRRPGEED